MPAEQLHVSRQGSGPATVWIHGTMSDPDRTWGRQAALAERWSMLLPARRGTPPSPPADGNDFLADADDIVDLLAAPAHVVAHSYGCLGALLATGRRPESVRSLTLVEPPAFGLVILDPEVRSAVAAFDDLQRIASPDDFLPAFLEAFLGHSEPPRPLGADMRRLVELTMHERPPWTAKLPLAAIREAGTPTLVVTGGHSRLFDIAADALQAELGPTAGRVVLAGAGHAIPRLGDPFNAELELFWLRVEPPR